MVENLKEENFFISIDATLLEVPEDSCGVLAREVVIKTRLKIVTLRNAKLIYEFLMQTVTFTTADRGPKRQGVDDFS